MAEADTGSSGYRRTRRTAAGIAAVLAGTMVATTGGAGAQATSSIGPGVGNAIAQAVKVEPKAGNLSIAVTVGQALAGQQGSVGLAESKAVDLGVIGTTLGADGCDGGEPILPPDRQPQSLILDSREEGAASGRVEQDSWLPVATKSVRADQQPSSEAETTVGSFDLQGVLRISGIRSHSYTNTFEDRREAVAIVEIGAIELAGAVSIRGMRWEARATSGGDRQELTGSFNPGSAFIGNVPLALPDVTALLAGLNPVLNAVGLSIALPEVREVNGIVFVDPLGIQVIPNAARDGLLGSVLDGIHPIREATFSAILELSCSASTAITITDIAVGSLTGAGSFGVLLGGVQASSGDLPDNPYDFSGGFGGGGLAPVGSPSPAPPSAPPALGGAPISGGGTGRPTGSTPPATGGTTPPASPVGNAGGTRPEARVADIAGKRGGTMAGVGLAGLALLGLVAEGDRRKMRQAQRQIPLEA